MTDTRLNYPANLIIDYIGKSDRLTTFFRLILVLPILILLGLVIGNDQAAEHHHGWHFLYQGTGILFLPTLLMILFRQKYPKWWYDWNLALTKFSYRVFSYLILLRDDYPSTDEEQAVHVELIYPDTKKDLSRGMPLIKWFLAIPHLIILCFLYCALIVCTIIAWFTILFTGNYPKGLFDFVVGVLRWSLRVSAYAFLLTTDQYPPFSLE